MNTEPKNPISAAIDRAGNQTRLAEATNVRQQAVSKWLRSGRVPPSRAILIEKKYGISRAKLCPDVFGPAPDTEAAP